ncbi:phage tail protein [Plesiomonas shigelloides]|uniref:phage tail protein n=1 Tax=Plesiomonas shigelloides TaxID=703 RepID=UPI0012615685|nr:phage tail protein [Plesiomonas shigelloides]KAB7672829.1 phage tail protein [Plesiomonas shigelloides]
MAKYFAILTNLGAGKLANAAALGTELEITHIAVGDGGGVSAPEPTPDPAMTALLGEKRRAAINSMSIDPLNPNQIIVEQVIPETDGGFWIREIGAFDKAGTMIAYSNCAGSYKPQLQEGSGRALVIRMILIVSSTEAVSLKIDPSVVLATRKYVDDKVIEVKAYTDKAMADHLKAVHPHKQYALIGNAPDDLNSLEKLAEAYKKLQKYGCPLIGELIHWPHQLMPHEIFPDIGMHFIPYAGQPFDKSRFPLLAMIHPSGVLPGDMRGEFARGLDNGRGVDPGRVLMSAQASSNLRHSHYDGFALSGNPGGQPASDSGFAKQFFPQGTAGLKTTGVPWSRDAAGLFTSIEGDGEARSRNLAWNMAVRTS